MVQEEEVNGGYWTQYVEDREKRKLNDDKENPNPRKQEAGGTDPRHLHLVKLNVHSS